MEKPDEVIELFRFIEQNFDVKKFNYKGINFWPLIRAQIGFDLNFKKANYQSTGIIERKRKVSDILKAPYRYLKLKYAERGFHKSLKPLTSEFQVLAHPQSLFIDEISGKLYSRYIDPYYEILKSGYSSVDRFGFIQGNNLQKEFFHPVNFYNLSLFKKYIGIKSYIESFSKNNSASIAKIKEAFKEVNELTERTFNIRPFNDSLILSFNETLEYKVFFSYLFSLSNVNSIFLECFYDSLKMGLCAAAKEHSVKIIEIQHGGAEDNVYVPYINHECSYSILPDYLWCWSRSDKDLILKHNTGFKQLVPFVGGNMWLKKYVAGEITTGHGEQEFFEKIKPGYKKIILVTLQPVFISDKVILNTILNAPGNFYFIVRFHPFNTEQEKNDFKESVKNCANVDCSAALTANLFNLFINCDFQLTHSSTTAMEALVFNLPTIICSEYGFDFYKDQINDGVILHSVNPTEIIEFLQAGIELNREKLDYYLIRSDAAEAIINVSKVVGHKFSFKQCAA